MRNSFKIKSIVVFLLLPLLMACGPLIEFPGSGEAPRHFQLSPNALITPQGGGNNNGPITIYMDEVSASGVFKTTSILVQADANELQYYKDALWVDRTPTLVGRFLTQALETGRHVRVIAQENIEIPAQYRLKVDIREFSVSTGSSQVYVGISTMLVRNGPVEILAMENFDIRQNIQSSNIDHVVEGFNVAMNKAAQDLLNWLHATLEEGGA